MQVYRTRATQDGLGGIIRLFLDSAARFGHGIIQVLHYMKAIHRQASLGQLGVGGFVVGITHVRTSDFYGRTPVGTSLVKPGFQTETVATLPASSRISGRSM